MATFNPKNVCPAMFFFRFSPSFHHRYCSFHASCIHFQHLTPTHTAKKLDVKFFCVFLSSSRKKFFTKENLIYLVFSRIYKAILSFHQYTVRILCIFIFEIFNLHLWILPKKDCAETEEKIRKFPLASSDPNVVDDDDDTGWCYTTYIHSTARHGQAGSRGLVLLSLRRIHFCVCFFTFFFCHLCRRI